MAEKHHDESAPYQFDPRSPPDFESDRGEMRKLLRNNEGYQRQLNQIAARTRKVLELSLDDIAEIKGADFAAQIETNFVRYVRMLAEVVDELLPERTADESKWDRIDVLMDTRERMMERAGESDDPARGALPKDLTRRFEIEVIPRKKAQEYAVREVSAGHIGRLVTVTGLVTRVSTVKPLVFVAAYVCDACGNESYQAVRSTQFMPLMECSSDQCRAASKQARMMLQTRTSRFLKHQELTLQESPDQVPVGAIPRSMRVLVRGESVRKCHAGEKVSITGVKVPMQKSGFRAMKAGLTTDTTFDAILIRKTKPGYADEAQEDEEDMEQKIMEMSESRDCYERLSQSIAPEIFGMRDVKKALLLLMVGGVTKRMSDGLTIRGDINVILMGDPGVAKSQLLKHICTIAPRGIYTTGKGSSGAGLTAAVVRDPITDEMVLEGGALVLADMGIAAIDEFDKMEETDRTAIHEVMEQQTISISKAGICTTLNARASILAAANPVFGRYNKKKTPEENIELPAALMSRFDLMFILVDQPNRHDDEELAKHICYVHQHQRAVPNELRLAEPNFLRAYIKKARSFEPTIPRELTQHVVGTYVQARNEGRQQGAKRLMPTPRTLLSVLRLSQALARLRFADVVSEADIEEATRLWMESRASMLEDDDEEMQQRNQDVTTKVYTAIKEYMQLRDLETAKLIDITGHLKQKGFFDNQISETLNSYENLDIWMVNPQRTKLTLVR